MAREELYKSQSVTFTAEGIQGQRLFISLWDERFAVKPNIGEPFPSYPGLFCTQVRVEGEGQSIAGGGHTHARITADYSTQPKAQQQKTGKVIDESLEFAGEMLTKAGGKWKDCKNVVTEKDIGGQWFPRVEYTIEKTVSSITEWAKLLLKAASTVNSTQFLGIEPGHWLMQGASARSFHDELGKKKWTVNMSFIYNIVGWQKQWHKECDIHGKNSIVARWEEVLYAPEGSTKLTEKMYKEFNFNKLVPERKGD